MIGYKLLRELKNGEVSSLFINKKSRLPFNQWIISENHPTKGFKERPYFHCTLKPFAPHLSMKDRVWVRVEIKNYKKFQRPENQGGIWILAKNIKLIEKLCMEEI
jgi:hypothetical protein